MSKKLQQLIKKFKNSKNSLDSYQVISDFIKIIKTVPEFIEQIQEEGKEIRVKRAELNADKGYDFGYKDRKIHNQKREIKEKALHQLDPMFSFRNLHNVFHGIQPKNINNNLDWLFPSFGPDDPLPKSDKEEYLLFMEKLYKKILPFLGKEEEMGFDFNSKKSILYFQEKAIPISLNSKKTNSHYILKHIFNSDDLSQEFPFREISENTFKDIEYKWRKIHRACEIVKEKVYKATEIDDFIDFNTGKTACIKINGKYLE